MKMKWGVIGCGGIADRRTLPGMMLSDIVEVVAVMDANKAAAENCKEKYGAKYAFEKYEDVLALDEVEAVYIASLFSSTRNRQLQLPKPKSTFFSKSP